MKRLKQKVDELSSENSQLKRELQLTKKRYTVRIIASSLLAAIFAYIMHRFLI
jgi:cell shape-determining protein MreC